jgi:hypothetical protein
MPEWIRKLIDWAVARGWLPRGENHDPTDMH